MKQKILILYLIMIAATLFGCAQESSEEKGEREFFAMDTVMLFTVYDRQSEQILDAAEKEIYRLETLLSVSDENSEVYRINASETYPVTVSEETIALIEDAIKIADLTNGKSDLTIYPVVKAWGFTTEAYRIPDQGELDLLLSEVNYKNVILHQNQITIPAKAEIDLGSIAKGYAGDKAIERIKEAGGSSALVNLGGNVQTLGTKPDGSLWNVAIQDPTDPNGYIGVVSIRDQAVVTSGIYERYFEKDGIQFHHIIDPASGTPARSGLASVTVICESGTMADGLSTPLLILGLEAATDFWRAQNDFEAIFITEDHEIYITEGLDGIFNGLDNTYIVLER